MHITDKSIKTVLLFLTGILALPAFANQTVTHNASSTQSTKNVSQTNNTPSTSPISSHGNIVLQLGWFTAHQGKKQNITIEDLNGDYFTVTHHNDQNVLAGLGFFMDGPDETYINCPDKTLFSTRYGVNMFYLAQTSVKGNVIQEQLFTNLSYKYNVTNFPIYLAAKGLFHSKSDKYNLTLDLGVGPNFIRASNFSEQSIDGGITIPDHAFSNHTKVAVSGMVGVGIQFNNVYRNVPLECGYRFFYLGRGHFHAVTDQLTSTLNTGNSYANALMCSVTV